LPSQIPQDPTLFEGTLRKNLDPYSEHTDSVLLEALAATGLTSTSISSAGDGTTTPGGHQLTLQTEISAGGESLSQGQRQLVSLARGLCRRSQIVILDEVRQLPCLLSPWVSLRSAHPHVRLATGYGERRLRDRQPHPDVDSDLAPGRDAHHDRCVGLPALSFFLLLRIRLLIPRASLRAAHRLRSIIDYDLIVVLGAGKLLEMGTPKELIERGQGGELWRAVEASADRAELREMAGVVDA
jgi:hypothetical protein